MSLRKSREKRALERNENDRRNNHASITRDRSFSYGSISRRKLFLHTVFINIPSVTLYVGFSFAPYLPREKCACLCFRFFPPLPLDRGRTAGETALRTLQLTAVERYYILVKAMHRERFQASSKLEIWPRLISTRETKRGIITRSFPAARLEGPPKCDQVFPTRPKILVGSLSHSASFAERTGKAGIILALCEQDACREYLVPVRPPRAVTLRQSV